MSEPSTPLPADRGRPAGAIAQADAPAGPRARAPAACLADPPRRRWLAATLALPLAACGTPGQSIAPPALPAGPPRVRVGERWRYGLTNEYNGLPLGILTATVAEAAPAIRISLQYSNGRPPAEEFYADAWRIVQDPNWDVPIVFATPQPLVPVDLAQPRAESSGSNFRTPMDSGEFWWQQTLTPRGWERVSVPAGRFDCLRVDRIISFKHPDLLRLRSERSETLWYAPTVAHWVQRVSTGYFWRSSLRYGGMREDWVLAQLLDTTAPPTS